VKALGENTTEQLTCHRKVPPINRLETQAESTATSEVLISGVQYVVPTGYA